MQKRMLLIGTFAALVGVAGAAYGAEEFPSRPIQVVIPFQPGDTDNMLRPFLDRMGDVLGQPVVLNYRPGAGGAIGAGEVAASDPDGYTLVGTSPGSVVVAPLANPQARHALDDFIPVASLAEGGIIIVVQAGSPWSDFDEFVGDARQRPGEITFGTSGTNGITHLATEALGMRADFELTHIPYQGSGPAIAALLGGEIDMSTSAIGPAAPHIREGTLVPLAVMAEGRLDAYPDVPTVRELGYDFGAPLLYGILAPSGTPESVVSKLATAAETVVSNQSEEIAEILSQLDAQINFLPPDDYAAYLNEQNAIFSTAME